MDEVVKLAKYLTLHIAAMDAKSGLMYTHLAMHGLAGFNDADKLLEIAEKLDVAVTSYLTGVQNVSKS